MLFRRTAASQPLHVAGDGGGAQGGCADIVLHHARRLSLRARRNEARCRMPLFAKLRHGAASNKMVLVGNTHLGQVGADYFTARHQQAVRKELGVPKGKKVVLFLVGLQWAVVKSPDLWRGLLDGLGDDVVKIFKWHPKVTAVSFRIDYRERFNEIFPSCIVVQDHDPYSLLAIADCCVALGKTTLGVEALSFGRPLFSRPGLDGEQDHYVEQGIAQSVANGWESLYRTLYAGVPTEVQGKVDEFLDRFFHRRNREAASRARQVMEVLVDDSY